MPVQALADLNGKAFPRVYNPRKNALLKDGNKSDRIDSRKLAHLLRCDQLKPVYHGETGEEAGAQPVRVFTKMSGHIPLLVRTMWFDLPGLGFNVVYKRLEDGVWFPSSFGTEFRMHVGPMFFTNRDISISLKNSGFEHTHVETK